MRERHRQHNLAFVCCVCKICDNILIIILQVIIMKECGVLLYCCLNHCTVRD